MTNVEEPEDLVHTIGERRFSRNSSEDQPDQSGSKRSSSAGTGGYHLQSGTTPQFSHFVVVAIDFGTTYSGYAYSFTHEPENIHIMRKWEGTGVRS